VRILAALLRATRGHARVGGFDVERDPHEVRRLIGYARQSVGVDDDLKGIREPGDCQVPPWRNDDELRAQAERSVEMNSSIGMVAMLLVIVGVGAAGFYMFSQREKRSGRSPRDRGRGR
jgi:hypothetical protein